LEKTTKDLWFMTFLLLESWKKNDRVEKILEKTVTKSPNLEVGINVESLESEQILNKNLKRSMPK
jgi:hypothetical protein